MKKKTTINKNQAIQGLLSILPVILILLAIRAYPIFVTLIKSFTNWDGLFKSDFVGINNYIKLFRSEVFWKVLGNTAIALINVPLQVFVGLVVALLLYEKTFMWKFFRSIFYLPQIISTVIIGYMFRILFAYDGPVNFVFNHLLKGLGFKAATVDWLANGPSAMFVVILCLVWLNIGYQGILILGGMSSISPTIFEASRLDGANYWQRMFYIVIPMLVRTLEFSFIMSISWTFSGMFPFIYTITKGGPGYETTTIDYLIYVKAFLSGGQMGQACTIAVILLIIVLAITILQITITNKLDDWSD
jgi:multiple sugar transport system permease protein